MFILYWIFFVLLLYMYGKILLPIFENILSVIFQPNLAEGMSFFLIFSLSVLTLAKFLNGDFHIFFSNLFSSKGISTNNQDDIKDVKNTNQKFLQKHEWVINIIKQKRMKG